MAAITKSLLHLRPTVHFTSRPNSHPLRHFSSSDTPESDQSPPHSSVSSSLNDVRASLQNTPPPTPRSFPPPRNPPPPRSGSREDVSQLLSEFRARSAPPPPSSVDKYVSLHELYEKNIKSKARSSDSPPPSDGNRPDSGKKAVDRWSISKFTRDLKMKADLDGKLGAGGGGFVSPFSHKDGKGLGFGKIHDRSELGKRLQAMRPEKRKGKWFSLQEMSDRLAKVREAQNKELGNRSGLPHGVAFGVVDGLLQMHKDSVLREKQKHPVNINILGSMGAALDEKIAGPPKDHLIEKYFHPDNMSSAEKLKLELKKVRDEFKMSESDCGSARVQVAQLTTKIKHLSSVLHKKDKHSTRGLLAMVQRRKKLLKYLRRTDWDSYCFVLTKLGLRDNPDVKA
ncbi:hypothetical protein SASPL_114922 [Salvia splendens]|uniref:Small ribosomal subunit protein uS15c n=1 Tax=Salvia splendens TaxID=180675 RepID=A0A8X8Y486_SALSN|nr:uncharacterized protein LOC121802808 [Salvia splendens]KAG6424504.1 hypothetical protein SASPL_114922 [Salvia splendens]